MRRVLLIPLFVGMVGQAFLLAQTTAGEDVGAAPWADERTGRIVERYVDILAKRPIEGSVFRSLATLYDNAGRLDDLAERFRKSAETDAETNAWDVLSGHLALYRGDAEGAAKFYRAALVSEGPVMLANAGLGRALEAVGRWQDAEETYAAALAAVDEAKALGLDLDDETGTLVRSLGRVALRAGRADAARVWWNRLVEMDPDNPDRLRDLAQLLAENRLFDDAVETMKRCIAASADDPRRHAVGWRDLGDICDKADRPDDAFEAYRRAFELTEPGNWLRREVNGRVLALARRTGTMKDLERRLVERAEKMPGDVETWQQLARVRAELLDREGVVEAWRQVVELTPGMLLSVRLAQAEQLEDAGAWTEAVEARREIVKAEPKEPKHRFELARVLIRAGEQGGAQEVWQDLGVDFGADPLVQLQLGHAWEDASRWLDAEKAYLTAVAADPDTFTYRRELGEFYIRRGSRLDAETAWRSAVVARPDDVDAHVAAAEVFRKHGMNEDALRSLKRAAELRPREMQRWRDLASLCLEMDLPTEAVDAWERAAREAASDADRDEAIDQVLGIHESRDRLDELVADYEKRLAADPNSRSSVLRLARALERSGDVERAGALYERYLAGHPDDAWMLASIAHIRRREGRVKEAMTIYRRLIVLDPSDVRVHIMDAINTALDADLPEEALKLATELVERRYPHDVRAWLELARVQERMNRIDEALATLERASSLRPDDAEVIEALGRIYETSGDLDRLESLYRRVLRSTSLPQTALECARKLIDLTCATSAFGGLKTLFEQQLAAHPRDFAWYRAMAEYLLADERPDEARALYRRALDVVPAASRGDALDALSRLDAQLGDIDEAIRYAEEYAATVGGSSTDHLPALAELYLRSRRFDDARRALRTWGARDPGNLDIHRTVAEILLKHGDVEGAVEALKRQLALPPRAAGEEGLVEHHQLRLRIAGVLAGIPARRDEAEAVYMEVIDKTPYGEPPANAPASAPSPGSYVNILGATVNVGPLTPPPPGLPGRGPAYGEVRLQALEGLVRLALRRDDPDSVVKCFEKRLAAEPAREQHYEDLARVLELLGRENAMLDLYRRARKRFADSADWTVRLAGAARRAGRDQEALDAYRELREGDPTEPFTNEVVEILLRMKRPDDVVSMVKDMLASGQGERLPTDIGAQCGRAGEEALAAQILELVAAAAPEREMSCRLEIARHYYAAGKGEEAWQSIKRFLDVTRESREAPMAIQRQESRRQVMNAAWQVASVGDRRRLLTDIEKQLAERSKDALLIGDLAFVCGRLGRVEEEARLLERLAETTKDPSCVPAVVAAWQRAGHPDHARTFLGQVLKDVPPEGLSADFAAEMLRDLRGLTPDDPLAGKLVAAVLRGGANSDRLYIADFYSTHGMIDEAIALLRKSIETDPGELTLRLRFVDLLKSAGRVEEADEVARQAAAIASIPPDPELEPGEEGSLYVSRRSELSGYTLDVFAHRGYASLMVERFRRLRDAHPDEIMRTFDLALACRRAGDDEAALKAVLDLSEKKPNDLQVSLAVIEQLSSMGRTGEVVKLLEKIVRRTRPARAALYEELAAACARAGDVDAEKIVRLRKAMIFHRYDDLADLARREAGRGRRDEALLLFRKYMRLRFGPMSIYGDAGPSTREYARFLLQAGFPGRAIEVLERTLAVLPASETSDEGPGPLYGELTSAYEAVGRLDELVRRYERRVADAPADVIACRYLADLYGVRGETSREIETRILAQNRRPNDVNNLSLLALALRRERRFDESIAVYRELLKLEGGGGAGYLTPIAEMHYEKGDLDGAVKVVEEIVSDRAASRNSEDRLRSAALLYERFGLYEKEEETLRAMLAMSRDETPYHYVSLIGALLKRGRIEAACDAATEGVSRLTTEWHRTQILDEFFDRPRLSVADMVRVGGLLTRSPIVTAEPSVDILIAGRLHSQLLAAGRQDLAAACALSAWRRHRDEIDLAIDAISDLLDLGRLPEAESLLHEVASDGSRLGEQTRLRIRLRLAQGRLDEAQKLLDHQLRRAPDGAERRQAGGWYLQAGQPRPAADQCLAVWKMDDRSVLCLALAGQALMQLDERDRLKTLWTDVLKGAPDESALLVAAKGLLVIGEIDAAGGAFRRLLAVNPRDREGMRGLTEVLRRQGRLAEAIPVYRDAPEVFGSLFRYAPDFLAGESQAVDVRLELLKLYRQTETLPGVVDGMRRELDDADEAWSKSALDLAAKIADEGRIEAARSIWRRLVEVTRDGEIRRTAAERLKE